MSDEVRIDIVFLDLDDTIWRGTWEEGSPRPLLIQPELFIAECEARGAVVIACTSIAPEARAHEALRESTACVDEFVGVMSCVVPKALAIEALAERMQVPLRRVCLIDDSAEARLAAQHLGIRAFASVDAFLLSPSWRKQPQVSMENRRNRKLLRRASFQLAQPGGLATSQERLSAFLRESALSVEVARTDAEGDLDRVCELLLRANQLHLRPSLFREPRELADVQSWLRTEVVRGASVYGVRATMYGRDLGIQGCVIAKEAADVVLVLDAAFSCSILPFQIVDSSALASVLRDFLERVTIVEIPVEPVPGNARFRWVLEALGGKVVATGYRFTKSAMHALRQASQEPGARVGTVREEGIASIGQFFDSHVPPLVEGADRPVVLDVGFGYGEVLGSARNRSLQALVARRGGRLLRLDRRPRDASVEQGNAEHLQSVGEESVDVVLLLEVLEHVREPWLALSEAMRVLKRGGATVISVPGPMYPYHPFDEDHSRFTIEFLRRVLEPYGRVDHAKQEGYPDMQIRSILLWRKEEAETGERLHDLFARYRSAVSLPGGLWVYTGSERD